ncbi:MAG: hypothetical protein OXI96_00930 [Acidimicrobiaceae bacterium]|nr:hypothetical protein [Acidimicrobiaceae bacterium]
MLDHIFMDAVGALRDGLEDARLECLTDEEHLQHDILLGDLIWETSYGLPGEGLHPRISSELTMHWSAESQAVYRSWIINDDYIEPPSVGIEITFCMSNLIEQSTTTARTPQPADTAPLPTDRKPTRQPIHRKIAEILPQCSPKIGDTKLERGCMTSKTLYDDELNLIANFFEVPYEGAYYLDENVLADGSRLDEHFNKLGSWVSSILARIGHPKLSSAA